MATQPLSWNVSHEPASELLAALDRRHCACRGKIQQPDHVGLTEA
jgi:hypothetical protein